MYSLACMLHRLSGPTSLFVLLFSFAVADAQTARNASSSQRQRVSLNEGWRFMRYNGEADKLMYDDRPKVTSHNDNVVADTRASDSGVAASSADVLKKWVLPTALLSHSG